MALNAWDVQSKRIYTTDEVSPPLYAGEHTWTGMEIYILTKEGKDDSEPVWRTEQAHPHD